MSGEFENEILNFFIITCRCRFLFWISFARAHFVICFDDCDPDLCNTSCSINNVSKSGLLTGDAVVDKFAVLVHPFFNFALERFDFAYGSFVHNGFVVAL